MASRQLGCAEGSHCKLEKLIICMSGWNCINSNRKIVAKGSDGKRLLYRDS